MSHKSYLAVLMAAFCFVEILSAIPAVSSLSLSSDSVLYRWSNASACVSKTSRLDCEIAAAQV